MHLPQNFDAFHMHKFAFRSGLFLFAVLVMYGVRENHRIWEIELFINTE